MGSPGKPWNMKYILKGNIVANSKHVYSDAMMRLGLGEHEDVIMLHQPSTRPRSARLPYAPLRGVQ